VHAHLDKTGTRESAQRQLVDSRARRDEDRWFSCTFSPLQCFNTVGWV